uniref:Sesquiterpene synthase 2 n=1 Tax=Postia placenta (strain ATCC 44394 / Madison 698-R) TaxID=561896 RepID=STS2_POSPM|nr:RecName: Full=Sesquiterpene synthase 2; AltName: Full=Terpene cyclase 2 [Postia placenta Mad-698-R]BBD74518.1 sesquiterpene synthase [Postia placenta Mad-698-R]
MSSSVSSTSAPTKIVIPDLVSHCTIPVRCNRHWKQASVESKRWLFRGGNLSDRKRDAFHGLKAGYLTSMCYPLAGYPQLRVSCDFMNYLFHLDNISDEMNDRGTHGTAVSVLDALYQPHMHPTSRVGKMTKDYWVRLIQTASPGAQQRFIETFDMFFQAVTQQAMDRANGVIPDLESYIAIRRDTSGCKPCWALIEYANNLDLPWEIMDHPIIRGLGEAANDLVTWSNDIFSYNVEQSKGDTHNMIVVVQNQQGLDLQSAVNFVGDLCKQSIDRFHYLRENLPSWGPELDREVEIYVDGLADWITGSLKWSFESERYFGKAGLEVKKTRVVALLPRRA